MKEVKVTVITVTYNLIKNGREKSFRQCVESVHNQTYKNIEHLIIDGASTDGTLDLIKEYEQKGWIRYISEPDKGIADAMNKGIKNATGEYIAILNSDDWYTPNMVSLSVKALKRENADYSYANSDMLKDGKIAYVWSCSKKDIASFFIKMPFNHETMLCKKKVYEDLNYYNWEDYGTAADIDFLNRLILEDYKGVGINESLLQFRLGGTTSITNPQEEKESYRSHILKASKIYLNLYKQIMPKETHAYYEKKFNNRLPSIAERNDECTLSFALNLTKFLCMGGGRIFPLKNCSSIFKI